MNDHVILFVGDQKFVLTPEEAMGIANTLNAATRLSSDWKKGGSQLYYDKPKLDAAYVVPINATLQFELETNTRERVPQ